MPGSKGYLDQIRLNAKSKLQGFGKQFLFQYDLSGSNIGIVSYNFSNASAITQVWDVTDTQNITNLETYVKKFLRDYNQFGFEVTGLKSIKNNST